MAHTLTLLTHTSQGTAMIRPCKTRDSTRPRCRLQYVTDVIS